MTKTKTGTDTATETETGTRTETLGGHASLEPKQPRPRADAVRNRERIVTAAREMFAEWGVEVPLDEIARRAGVGNATLYRHFPDRRDLIHQVTLSAMVGIAELAEAATAAEGDEFDALRQFVFRAAEERVGSLCPMLVDGFDRSAPEVLATRVRLEAAVEALMARARKAGRLRADVAVGDLMVAISQLTRPLPGTPCGSFDRFVRRHLQLFLDGLMAPARTELPGVAVTFEDLEQKRSAM